MKNFFIVFAIVFLTTGFLNAQGKTALGFNVGAGLPIGDFGDGFDVGYGGNAIFVYHTSPNFDVTGSAGYLTWGGKDDNDGATFSTIPVLVGGRYILGKGNLRIFIAGALGMHFTSFEVDVLGESVSTSDSYFGYNAGGGILLGIGKNMDLDVNVLYNGISSEGGSSEYVSIFAGLIFGLN